MYLIIAQLSSNNGGAFIVNEKNIYFIGLAISVLLIILSIYCCPFCAAILSGVGCSGVAATVMAYFLERASAKRKADRLKNARYVYFQSLNNQISMLIGRTLWFYYRLVDETFNWSLQDDKYFTVSYQLEARRRYQDIHSSFDVAINLLCSIKGEFNSDATVARSECWQNNVQRMFSILHYSCYFLLCEANVIMHDRFQLEIQEYLDIKDTEQLMQNISYTVNLMAQDNANYEAIFDSLILAATKVRSIGNYNNEITVGLHSSMTIPDALHNN